MQKLDMAGYGVEELDANEMKNLDGGGIITIVALGLLCTINEIISTVLLGINSAAGDILIQPEIVFGILDF